MSLNSYFVDISIIGLLALGQMLVILTGGIDLSVGTTASCASVTLAWMMLNLKALPPALNLTLSILFSLMFGALLGTINGFATAILKIPPLIATLGGMWIAKGMGYFFLKGMATSFVVTEFSIISHGGIWIFPFSLFLFGILSFTLSWFLKTRRSGRAVYATGGNEYSAYISGIKVRKVKWLAYISSAVLATLAGLVLGAYTGVGYVKGADGYELFSIAAVVIGGVAMSGGEGNVLDAVLGVFVLRLINKLMVFANLATETEGIYVGIILLVTLFLSTRKKRDKVKLIAKSK